MKKFAFAVMFAVVAVAVPLSSSCGGGPKCKKIVCVGCSATQYCDTSDFSCKDNKTCSPACKTDGTEYCDPQAGSCKALKLCSPMCKTDGSELCDINAGSCKATPCKGACAAGKYCDTASDTCKDNEVCSPVCDATKGEYCTR